MAHPLELSYNWRTPVLFATIGAVSCLSGLIRGRVSGWLAAVVVVAQLKGGRSTLFAWILAEAPHAELDNGSQRTVERLQSKGLLP